jgi:hypothetical protein
MIKGTEIFVLTSGHCMGRTSTGTEAITQKVLSAYPATPATERNIGEKVTFNNTASYDLAEVKIENNEWLLRGGLPAMLVEWQTTPREAAVIGKALNLVGELTCHVGAATRLQCGKILRTGATVNGIANLIETSARAEQRDSGGPEFLPGAQGALIQGVATLGEGALAFKEPARVTSGSPVITGIAPLACPFIAEMEVRWPAPVTGTGIPAGATVKTCNETMTESVIEMSASATQTGTPTVTVGYETTSSFEPISQVEALFSGQTLLVQ